MINAYITIGLILALPFAIVGFIATGGKQPVTALCIGLMAGMMWPALLVLILVEYYVDSA